MHPDLAAHLDRAGFVTRPQFLANGLDDRSIAAAVREGAITWIGPGLYAGRNYGTMSPEERHVLRCHAVATRFDPAVAFTHQSAALLHGLATWGADLGDVHVTRLDDGRGRRQAHVAHHVGQVEPDELSSIDGLTVSDLPRTVWDLACSLPTESALVSADSALHRGLVTDDELTAMADRYTPWRGSRHAKVVLSLSDAGAASPGESRLRYAIHDGGLPRPRSQFKIYGTDGTLAAITDLAWPAFRHVVEFDGLIKYGQGADLAREKAREDLIRSLGWGVTRVVWSQLSSGSRSALITELTESMARSRRQFGTEAS